MKRLSLFLTLVTLTAGVACGLSGEPPLGNMTVRRESGLVKVLRGDEEITVEDDLALEPHDVVVTGSNGRARFNLEADRELEILGNARAEVRNTTSVEAIRGSLRGKAAGESLEVLFDGVTASATASNFRVDRGFGSSRVGTYTGMVALSAPGEDRLAVKEFFEATVAAGDVPSSGDRPYQLDPKDEWDSFYLRDWIDLGQELDTLSTGFSNQVVSDRPGVPYFAALAGSKAVGFVRPYLTRKPAELLIAFTVAQRAAGGSLAKNFRAAFGYRDRGAEWAIVAAIMDVKPRVLVASLSDVILGTGVVAASGETDQATFSVAAAEAATGPSSDQNNTIGNDPNDDSGTSPPDDDNPGDGGGGDDKPGGDDEPRDCANTVECAGQEITDQLDRPTPTPTDGPLGVIDGGLTIVGELAGVVAGDLGH